jgi:tetratricopeptide (TPR) repeat protein
MKSSSSDRLPAYQHYELARHHMGEGKLDLAIQEFLASLAHAQHFKAHELVGECYLMQANYDLAIKHLSEARRTNNQVRAPSLLAETFRRAGRLEEARAVALEVLSVVPGNRLAKSILAKIEGISEA